ncbi:DNA polymerase III subunit delta [Ornithinibacillus halophilus]|uniref:DNA polymerase III subunit delta n=1 Tax=Ornithinibacillus halophilus TaxID=930117 RepID=A0A1M5DL17_9BACI|nr:DNA polymerase III subunit delta [Ornithinibacillus halophilus]SHF67594.1 DNA polymerase III, delta subunit [Ornithinibacillus halophilus]
MSYMDVMKQLKKKQMPHVFLLYGTEVYFIQKIKDEIEKKLSIDSENYATYDLTEIPIQEVISDAETYPFFGDTKLIIANNPVFLKAKPDKLAFEHDLDSLVRYIENPVDFSVLVLIAPYEKIDERKKVIKQLKKHATVAECNPIKEYELDNWIKNMADQLNIQIDKAAYETLETELSTNLNLLENELAKLAMYVGENGVVTKEIAEDLISHTVNSSALRLVDTVIEGNLQKAISIYKDLEKMKEEPIALIALLAFQFRNILRIKLLKSKGYSQFQMQKQLGVHPYVVKVALTRESKFSLERLKMIIQHLANADRQIKQGKMDKELAFELLLYQLIRNEA